ncbi:eukaryotic translation initiation factor 2D isoform X1 [Cinnamomum micranthum f. kanehirae]|uniref:Eukaryotic translation initiation factor 2D isoform X1 n=1 Tax=Cinnamomum micranthum f. kanehirae TaxID=337451 RepID=A0A443PHR6_9MAGN|nr:eukaryotic translation initiation factor 2D isoform X1 [Cinnamomum micranthum f. kanehirae]
MFKKAIEAKSLQRLSGADRKKLKRTVKEKFPQASDADIDIILPPKAEISVAKFPNRAHVYAVEGDFPMIFDIDGRGTEIYPTVYALWKVPNLLPAFLLKGGEVSRFVIGGADLMFPGISIPPEGLPSFSVGEPWAVKVPGNPAPIAVGITTMSSSEALKAGLRGKALRITHYYQGHHVPNAGFFEDVVLEDPALVSVCQTSEAHEDTCSASNDLHGDGGGDNGEGQLLEIRYAHIQLDVNASTEVDQKDEIPEEITADMSGLKVVDTVSSEEINAEQQQQHTLSIEEIDALLDKCLLQALHTTVKDKDLPIPGSTLWSSHVLPCRPSGITLDIKKSSHKKLSKWLQSKSSAGLISAKEDKHKKEVVLTRVNRGHPDYMSFRPDKRQPQSADHRNDSAPVEGRQEKLQLEVVEIYKPSTHVNPIFTSVGVDPGNFYSATEATDVVFKYAENQNLVKPTDKAAVVLDAVLCDALYKGTVKKGSSYPTEIHKKDLGPTFISRMQVHHRVSRGNVSAVRKGALKTVQIVTERRQGNKKVTRVSGLESFLMDAEALASELQKKFACSTSVAELPGKKGQHEVLVQGGVIHDLGKILVEQYGIPKRYIEVLDKTRK